MKRLNTCIFSDNIFGCRQTISGLKIVTECYIPNCLPDHFVHPINPAFTAHIILTDRKEGFTNLPPRIQSKTAG
jgi:hypothetical protein